MERGKFNIVIGGQAGSEAKGKFPANLTERYEPDIIHMTSSPNAGHTVIMGGEKFVTHHLPVGMVGMQNLEKEPTIIIGPASLLNLETFIKELDRFHPYYDRVIVDERATIITPGMMENETKIGLAGIGSTLQGVGAARITKLMRPASLMKAGLPPVRQELEEREIIIDSNTSSRLYRALMEGQMVLGEMTQGFDLCLEHGIDPMYCTTRIINPAAALADAGVPPSMCGTVYGVIRTYPIRVNNREGSSGPYAEAAELSWKEVARRAGTKENLTEYTTTTKLPRRVFEFCWSRYRHFLRVCNPDIIALQFVNYLDWNLYEAWELIARKPTTRDFLKKLQYESSLVGARIGHLGTGPDHAHFIDWGF